MGKCSRTPGSKKYFIAGLANGPDMGYIYQTGEETPPHGEKAGLTYQARRPGWKVDRRQLALNLFVKNCKDACNLRPGILYYTHSGNIETGVQNTGGARHSANENDYHSNN